MAPGEGPDARQGIQDGEGLAEEYVDDDFVSSEADEQQAGTSTWQHQSPPWDQAPKAQKALASSSPETTWQPAGQHQVQQHGEDGLEEEGVEGADVWYNTTEDGEPETWVTYGQDEAAPHQPHHQQQQQHARPKTRSGRQQQTSSNRGRDCVFRRPPTANRYSQGPAPRPASAGQTWSTTDHLLSQRPVSACLRSIDLTKLPSSSSSRAGTPASLLAAAVAVVRPKTAGADMSACGRVKRYTPGPASYAPRVDRRCTTLISSAAGSFPRASKDHCSHIQAHLQTVCSPGPAAAGAPRPHSSCSAYGAASRSRSGSPTGHSLTARLQHTPGGTWCRAGVGTREMPRPKTAPARSSSSGGGSSSSRAAAEGRAQGVGGTSQTDDEQQQRCVCCGGTSSCREATCGVPWGYHLGPGRYDSAVQRDGSTVLFGSTGSAWSWGKAPKMASPVTQPRSITYISPAHAREMCGAATPGPQHYQPRHPGVLSHPAGTPAAGDASAGPSMEGKGVNVWTRMEAAARNTPGCTVRSASPPTHKGKPMWPATPAACINRPASSRPQQPFLSARHCTTLNHSSYQGKTHYAYDPGYTQQDKHVGVPHLGSGQKDRFDDYNWSSGRIQ